MSFSERLCNAFIKVWNNNALEYVKRTNMKRVVKIYIVNYFEKKIRERTYMGHNLNMFYAVFNSSVCDSDHWEFFQECLNYTYQENRATDKFNKKYISFREYWDKHIDDFNRQFERKFAGNNRVIVLDGKNSYWYELAPNILKCFYIAFNEPVCDYEHWQYFKECILNAGSMVGITAIEFDCVGVEELDDKVPSFTKQLIEKQQHRK